MDDLKKYLGLMEEIKVRVEVVDKFVKSEISLSRHDLDYEVISLNIRKILECISFSTLTSNKKIYEETLKNFQFQWRAVNILEAVEKLNPKFYPVPIYFKNQLSSGVKHYDVVEDGFLTRKEFEALYDRCSKILHSWNPYHPGSRHIHFGYSVSEWIERIQKLLSIHYTSLLGSNEIWIIVMSDPRDGKVHGFPTGQEI